MDIETVKREGITPEIALDAYAESGVGVKFGTFGDASEGCVLTAVSLACFPGKLVSDARERLTEAIGAAYANGVWRGFDNSPSTIEVQPQAEYDRGKADGLAVREIVKVGQALAADLAGVEFSQAPARNYGLSRDREPVLS